MAEALLIARLGEQALDNSVSVTSAGVGALVGHRADAHAERLMVGQGLDIRAHRARAFTGAMGLAHDLILTMNTAQRHHVECTWPLLQGRTFILGHFDDQEIDDPYRKGAGAFRDALVGIEQGVAQWVPVIAR